MTLFTLVLYIAIIAIVLTLGVRFMAKGKENVLLALLQNFCGALFVFSGWVKAIDPLGTAYKMEQYFAEFYDTFSATWFSFLTPLFPWLSEHSAKVSMIMIIFEIMLGILLLLGSRSKFTSWAFLLLVGFFTFLTGFTYLTGYVPDGVNFFEFGNWGEWVETNMKVTDCGCFGDFLVLKPKISFFKDVFLLIPAILFVIASKAENQFETNLQRALAVGFTVAASLLIILWNGYPVGLGAVIAGLALAGLQMGGKKIGLWGGTAVLILYCMSNFVWDIPSADFRPFATDTGNGKGENIYYKKLLEETSEGNVPLLAYKLTNKASGEVKELLFADYMKVYKDYPKEEWDLHQIKGEETITVVKNGDLYSVLDFYEELPAESFSNYLKNRFELKGDTTVIPFKRSKISDFEVSDVDGNSMNYEILSDPNYSFMVVAYKIDYKESVSTAIVNDTLFTVDTVLIDGTDSMQFVKSVDKITPREVKERSYSFGDDYKALYTDVVNPVLEAGEKDGMKVFAVTAYADGGMLDDFRHATQSAYPFYVADDILLKTIVRSNPGVVLLKNGVIVAKWHQKKLPSFETIKAQFMK